jgi:tetratricopeptide (TPR) repeat protein
MEIHLLLSGEQIGPFSETLLRQYLAEGLVSPSDLAFHEGMEQWQPLELVLAQLTPPDAASETISRDQPLPVLPAPPNASAQPELPFNLDDDTRESFEPPPAPPPAKPDPSLEASPKSKRKPGKIVIQPILPLEPTVPVKKNSRTGKTALTLEPLRPTTALPPVMESPPGEEKSAPPLVRTDQALPRDLAETPAATPSAPPFPAPLNPPEQPQTDGAALLPQPARPLSISAKKAPTRTSWFGRIPPWMAYAGAAAAVVLAGIICYCLCLAFSSGETMPPENPVSLGDLVPPPAQVEIQSPESGPKTASDWSDRGFARQGKGDLDGAISDYNQALALDRKNVEAWFRRGLAWQAKGDYANAIADYTQVVALDPKRSDALSNRGFIKQGQGDYAAALADYKQALVINPKMPRAYYDVGLIEAQGGELDEAIAAFDRALEFDPKMAFAYYNRGLAKNTEGNLDGAIADYTQALALNPNMATAYRDRGLARQTKGDSDGALADYSHALDLDPKMASAFYNRGLIKMQKGDLDGAVADNRKAIELDPKNGQAYFRLGLAQLGQGSLDDALTDLKQFCELSPRDGAADVARLYIWLISTEQNPKGDADAELSTALLNDWNSPPEDLTSKIAAFLLGHSQESELIANAASPDPTREPGQYCRVWYFAGMKRLLGGDTTTAIAYFQKCLATQQKDYCEYIFAQAELQALGRNREVAAKPEPSQ